MNVIDPSWGCPECGEISAQKIGGHIVGDWFVVAFSTNFCDHVWYIPEEDIPYLELEEFEA